ncbi:MULTISPECIES: transposase [Sphingomonas]|uniref:Transposase n=1 Tax=Sphingomonas bisphenolicum TaxID=296544 RepID=A0ABM7G7R0_9SPHN|nr:transposase [Sphingomonas bisphenolicum]BBF70939.1 transposase [Sphingomonas bisphenolicum]
MSLHLLIRMEDAGALTMPCDDACTSNVQRFEVFTGAGRRRDWAPEVKAAIIAESYSKQETVCAVARRRCLSPSQLFTWRRQLRQQMEARGVALPVAPTMASAFVPAIIEERLLIKPAPAKRPRKQARAKGSAVELEVDRGGRVGLNSDRHWISGSSAGCLLALPIWGVI